LLSHDRLRPRQEPDGFWRRKQPQACDGQSCRSFRRIGAPLAAISAHDAQNRPVLSSDRASGISLGQAGARPRLSVTGRLQGLDRRWSGITPSSGVRPSMLVRDTAYAAPRTTGSDMLTPRQSSPGSVLRTSRTAKRCGRSAWKTNIPWKLEGMLLWSGCVATEVGTLRRAMLRIARTLDALS
jgi:hypothetical protein